MWVYIVAKYFKKTSIFSYLIIVKKKNCPSDAFFYIKKEKKKLF